MKFSIHPRAHSRRVSILTASFVTATITAISATNAVAQTAPSFAVGGGSFVQGLFIDGDTLAIGASSSGIVWRNGHTATFGSTGSAQALCGRRVGDHLVIVRVGHDSVSRSDGINATVGAVPVIEREKISSCAVDPSGDVYFVGEHRAVYRWRGNDWSVLSFAAATTTYSVAIGADSTLYIATSDGLVRRTQTGFERVSLGAVSVPTTGSVKLWISDRTQRLYLAHYGAITVFDPSTGRATQHRHTLFGSPGAITGVASPAGDLIAFAAQSNVALFDGSSFTQLPQEFVFARGLAFDLAGGALYVGAQSELGAVAITHPWLRAAASAAPAPVAEPASQSAPTTDSAALGAQRINVASTSGSTTTAAPAESAMPTRREPYTIFPVVRFGFGVASGQGALRTNEAGFAFDATAGLIAFRERRGFQFMPELGVSHQVGPTPGGTYFTLGTSALFGTMYVSGGVLARGVFGGNAAGFTGGLRTGLVVQFLYTSISLDLSYQLLTAIDNRHGFVATLSFNPVPLVGALFLAAMFRSNVR